MPWDETQQYIRSGHKTSDDFDPQTLKLITLNQDEGIHAITEKVWGQQTTEVVSYLFSKEKNWTQQKAQDWFTNHEKKATKQL